MLHSFPDRSIQFQLRIRLPSGFLVQSLIQGHARPRQAGQLPLNETLVQPGNTLVLLGHFVDPSSHSLAGQPSQLIQDAIIINYKAAGVSCRLPIDLNHCPCTDADAVIPICFPEELDRPITGAVTGRYLIHAQALKFLDHPLDMAI